jgi:hypothetical protein
VLHSGPDIKYKHLVGTYYRQSLLAKLLLGIRGRTLHRSPPQPRTTIQKSRETPIDSADGAGASTLRPLKQQKTHLENVYSLMHVTEVPIYWTPSQAVHRVGHSPSECPYITKTPPRQVSGDYTHINPCSDYHHEYKYYFQGAWENRILRSQDCSEDICWERPKKEARGSTAGATLYSQ